MKTVLHFGRFIRLTDAEDCRGVPLHHKSVESRGYYV
jgi:hypothetical protein